MVEGLSVLGMHEAIVMYADSIYSQTGNSDVGHRGPVIQSQPVVRTRQ